MPDRERSQGRGALGPFLFTHRKSSDPLEPQLRRFPPRIKEGREIESDVDNEYCV